MVYYAHKRTCQDGTEEFQTVSDHVNGVSLLAGEFARPFGAEDLAKAAGEAHDLGKCTKGFQDRLLRDGPIVDHATAGAKICWEKREPHAAFCVLGHHTGLPDMGVRGDQSGGPTFWGRMNRASEAEPADTAGFAIGAANPPAYVNRNSLTDFFFVRMLYSCLVDADFLDTERFMSGGRESVPTDMRALWEKLNRYIGEKLEPLSGELNDRRRAILHACIQAGERERPGLFTLTVPTGGGKTVSSLAFALRHAVTYGKRRVVYVIPYTSIIDQTVEKFSEILGEENVLAHHTGVSYDTGEYATEESVRKAKATENWDMPVIVTTAVQFFESLYASRSSSCRKLHALADSVVIFDEAQTLPIPYLAPCVHAIAELVAHYGVSAVLCTATQPALQPLFDRFLSGETAREICPSESADDPVFERVTYRRAGVLSHEDVCREMNGREQVLCIVNSRKKARDVFEGLCGDGCFHLSTLMYPAHRAEKLHEIRERLASGRPCRVVSTSLIEAGVDVDFPEVFREMAGMDSIVQAAGRCNREGKSPASKSLVTIFEPETPPPPMFAAAIGAAKVSLEQSEDVPGAVDRYFRELFDLKGEDALDQKRIIHRIQRGDFPFRSIAEDFHLIDSPTKTVYIPQGEGEKWVSALKEGNHSRALYRKLSRYAVSVYPNHFRHLYALGDMEELDEDTGILTNTGLYSEDTGLSLREEEGQAFIL